LKYQLCKNLIFLHKCELFVVMLTELHQFMLYLKFKLLELPNYCVVLFDAVLSLAGFLMSNKKDGNRILRYYKAHFCSRLDFTVNNCSAPCL